MNAPSGSLPLRDSAAILLVALCLGFAYNAGSPLGVRSATEPAAPSPLAPRAKAADHYSNETVLVATQPAAAPLADAGVQNETLTAEIVRTAPTAPAPAAPAQPGRKLPAALAWAEVKRLAAAGEVVLVDAREPAAFEAGHIPGAISLPFTQLNQRIIQFSASYPQGRPLVIYCASNQCPVSQAEALVLMEQFGYTNVREMPGGYAEWRLAETAAANPPAKAGP